MATNNWNKIAGWYDGMVGSKGHRYHQEYAIPTVMKLLEIKKGDRVLDVGCGQGALCPAVNKAEGLYFGVDASENMISSARTRHGKDGKFWAIDAENLHAIKELKSIQFDCAVFMLSIQDMGDFDKVLPKTIQLLKNKGKLVIFMMHPCFRIPRQSGWGEDKKRKIVYRRMDRYLSESVIPLDTNYDVTSYFYHRPLQRYFLEFAKNNLLIDKLLEIPEIKTGYEEFPTFMAIRGIKTL